MGKVIWKSDISTIIHGLICWLVAFMFMRIYPGIPFLEGLLIGLVIGTLVNLIQELVFYYWKGHVINLVDILAGFLIHLVLLEIKKLKLNK